ncbi:N-acetylmuramoyl-L-alanine amidase [Priestia koreensis]|uniref:N-acetylmuramoyl-L-alanine amidase n=1 Tax=Priestia koreensis TaxID=284581 RepID=UPI003D047EB9
MKKRKKWFHHFTSLSIATTVIFSGSLLSSADTRTSVSNQQNMSSPHLLQNEFQKAATEFHVPLRVLLSLSYNLSQFEDHDGNPSTSGGYGPMHLVDLPTTLTDDLKGDGSSSVSKQPLQQAAELIHEKTDVLKKNPVQNIRGAAALLANYAKEGTGSIPKAEEDWYGAVARYSQSKDTNAALEFADDVYNTIQTGIVHTTTDGQRISMAASPTKPNLKSAKKMTKDKVYNRAECPANVSCDYIPAFYEQKSANPSDYSNYDVADRPSFGPDIRYIVIHDTETSYDGTVRLFANPYSATSQYVVRSSDGHVTQMVHNKDIAWHAGNWYFNMHSVGIEHEGYALQGATWFSEPMYRSSAKLVRYLGHKYNIPLDRAHIIGHEEVPGLSPARQSAMHSDPGPFWDWEHYMQLVGAPITASKGKPSSTIVTLTPHFKTNKPVVSDASPAMQSANFIYFYTEPSLDAPLFHDPALKFGGSQQALDWGNKGKAGQTFALAETKGDWNAIWYGGQKVWFVNPNNQYTTHVKGTLITPKKGKQNIPVYGAAYPEASAYPEDVTARDNVPLQYTISEGQYYVAAEKAKSDFYNATTYTLNPYDVHKMVYGKDEYYRIHLNHRYAFVKAEDVDVIEN